MNPSNLRFSLNQLGLKFLAKKITLTTLLALPLLTATLSAQAANPMYLSNVPLGTNTGLVAQPSLLLILDDSGSMASNYLPNFVNQSICQDNMETFGSTHSCQQGDPPFSASFFNRLAYNPAITYKPPVFADGTSFPSSKTLSADFKTVPIDGIAYVMNQKTGTTNYGSSTTFNLVANYPDNYYCNTTGISASAAKTSPNCVRNMPGTTVGYLYENDLYSETVSNVLGAPYYYTTSNEQNIIWCADAALTDCLAAGQPRNPKTHTFPKFASNVDSTAANLAAYKPITSGTLTGTNRMTVSNIVCINNTTGTRTNVRFGTNASLTSPNTGTNTTQAFADSISQEIANDCSGNVGFTFTYNNTKKQFEFGTVGSTGNGKGFTLEIGSITRPFGSTANFTYDSPFTATYNTARTNPIVFNGANDAQITQPTFGVSFTRFDLDPVANASTIYPRSGSRTDCISTASGCTYTEEMTNFANWYTYYRTRMLTTKTALTLAFKDVSDTTPGNGFNVGFDRINNSANLPLLIPAQFGLGTTFNNQKDNFYNLLFLSRANGNTPLTRALSQAGLLYSGYYTGTSLLTTYTPTARNATLVAQCLNPRRYTRTGLFSSTSFFTCTNSNTQTPGAPGQTPTPASFFRTTDGTLFYPASGTTLSNLPKQNIDTSSGLADDDIQENLICTQYTGSGTLKSPYYCQTFDFQMQSPNAKVVSTNTVINATRVNSSCNNTFVSNSTTYYYCRDYNLNYSFNSYTLTQAPPKADPIRYSCQQNFTILTTDGYYNDYDGSLTNTNSPAARPKNFANPSQGTVAIGDIDGGTSVPPAPYIGLPPTLQNGTTIPRPYKDDNKIPNTLADIAFYYANTDIRPAGTLNATDNVQPIPGDPRTYQHMTTFTMGLGVDTSLKYCSDYLNGCSSDFNAIKSGAKSWPDPVADTQEARVDDLWHAAVNGGGKYFSANNPTEIQAQISEAISTVSIVTGAGAAAATSNLEPVAGDNFAYTASYTTSKWIGDLTAREIDLNTGALSNTPTWSAASQLDVLGASGSRTIYTYDPNVASSTNTDSDKKMIFNWANVNNRTLYGQSMSRYFDSNLICSANPNCALALPANNSTSQQTILNFLLGRLDATAGGPFGPQLRSRDSVLGDIVNTQPVYLKKPPFSYQDSGYLINADGVNPGFSELNANRPETVFVNANDGFLHAFNASNGAERWAYAPRNIVPALYQLAAPDYKNNHKFFVDGPISIGDAFDGSNWRSILISGFGAGGAGYFALDVTDPTAPKALWDKTYPFMGLSMGQAFITKMPAGAVDNAGNSLAGRWVALLSSGYNNGASINNTPATAMGCYDSGTEGHCPQNGTGAGKGYLYIVDVFTGQLLNSITTDSGGPNDPSGFAKFVAYAINPLVDNTTLYVYGGDLNGDLWKFDLTTMSSQTTPKATLMTSFSKNAQKVSITTRPDLSVINNKPVIFVGTGRFLQSTGGGNVNTNDTLDTTTQFIAAIADDNTKLPYDYLPMNTLFVEQQLAAGSMRNTRVSQNGQPVDWNTKRGWFVHIPPTTADRGERVNVDPKVQLGILVVASNVPAAGNSGNACESGGYGWINNFDINTGTSVNNAVTNPNGVASQRVNGSMIVGINVVKLPSGKLSIITTTANNQNTPTSATTAISGSPFKRLSWRELVPREDE